MTDKDFDESETSFLECTNALAKNIEKKTPSSELQVGRMMLRWL